MPGQSEYERTSVQGVGTQDLELSDSYEEVLTIEARGGGGVTFQVDGSIDGTNFTVMQLTRKDGGAAVTTGAVVDLIYELRLGALKAARINLTAIASATTVIRARLSRAHQ